MNIPTKLTVLRLLLVPLFMYLLLNNYYLGAFVIFIMAALTDFLDGYLARKWNQITDLGKLLDPLADKILVISALIIFVEMKILPSWSVVIIVSRELFVSIMRAVLAAKGVVVAAGKTGKAKTVTQMIAVILLMFILASGQDQLMTVALVIYYISVVLTVTSGAEYYLNNRQNIID